MKVDIELEKLGKISEMWERVPKETGWFKYEDGDNLEEFGKAAGKYGGYFLKEFKLARRSLCFQVGAMAWARS